MNRYRSMKKVMMIFAEGFKKYWSYLVLGGLVGILLLMKISKSDSSSGEEGIWRTARNFIGWRSQEEKFTATKSHNCIGSGRSFPNNPVAGPDWEKLLELIPPHVDIAGMNVSGDSVPPTFRRDSLFLAKIWAKRYRLDSSREQVLADRILADRSRRWFEVRENMVEFEHDGKRHLLGGAHIFQNELWAKNWIRETWAILAEFSGDQILPDNSLGNQKVLRAFAKQARWPEEMVQSYFGEEGSSSQGEPSEEHNLLLEISQWREDEVLFLFWTLPELSELLETTGLGER